MQKYVKHFIIPLARQRVWTSFCEIGASTGKSTDEILKLPIASYSIIDPCFDADLDLKYASDKRVTVHKCNSLDALKNHSGAYDCFLIDGDHNWYTVFNELRLIQQGGLLRPGGMIFFHDVEWPNGRRDMYYQPETIPPEFRHEYERKGILRGRSQLTDHGGTNPGLCNAVREGGPRNGVLTAIEDFYAENRSDYLFCRVRLGSGLGILQNRRKQPSERFSFLLIRMKAGIYSIYGLVHRLKRRL
ncbi:MAG: class I SAM-dependent methyltransferase [Terracidiphilus sp.]